VATAGAGVATTGVATGRATEVLRLVGVPANDDDTGAAGVEASGAAVAGVVGALATLADGVLYPLLLRAPDPEPIRVPVTPRVDG